MMTSFVFPAELLPPPPDLLTGVAMAPARTDNSQMVMRVVGCVGASKVHTVERRFRIANISGFGSGGKGEAPEPKGEMLYEELGKYFLTTSILLWLDIEEMGPENIHIQIADGYVWHVGWVSGIDEARLEAQMATLGLQRDDRFNTMEV
jgi:hypothetical protein